MRGSGLSPPLAAGLASRARLRRHSIHPREWLAPRRGTAQSPAARALLDDRPGLQSGLWFRTRVVHQRQERASEPALRRAHLRVRCLVPAARDHAAQRAEFRGAASGAARRVAHQLTAEGPRTRARATSGPAVSPVCSTPLIVSRSACRLGAASTSSTAGNRQKDRALRDCPVEEARLPSPRWYVALALPFATCTRAPAWWA